MNESNSDAAGRDAQTDPPPKRDLTIDAEGVTGQRRNPVRTMTRTFGIIKRVAIGYGLLLMLATGGLAFANIFGFAAIAIQFGGESSPDTTPVKTWMHIGWVFGVCVALLGTIVQRRAGRAKRAAEEAPTEVVEEPQQPSSKGRRGGLLVSSAWGGFFGALLGTGLGTTFILLWFSITYSPFAPSGWGSSVVSEKQRVGTSPREVSVATTRHPFVLFAFGLPVALGTIGGAVFGGIVRVTDEE